MRIKQKEIKPLREKMLKEQDFTCPLCETKIKEDEACLDHCHSTGRIRAVLHRSCNHSEGRVLNWVRRSRATDVYKFLANLVRYHAKDYSDNPIHPKHLTANEKELKKLRKHQKTLKSQKGREDVQVKIDSLIQQIEDEE